MPIPNRKPTCLDALLTVQELGIKFGAILDVGVQYQTSALKQAFPHIRHHLFEPVQSYFPLIEQNYEDFDYQLHRVAVSNTDGIAFLHSFQTFQPYGNDNSVITHSYVSDKPITIEEAPLLIECQQIEKRTLDTIVSQFEPPSFPYLLKIDVDGHDLAVLEGAISTLEQTTMVVIEAPLENILERSKFLTDRGFRLFDIVDISYYTGVLWQVDLIFVAGKVLDSNLRLEPMRCINNGIETFQIDQWYTTGYESE